jgi:hypothetical protein
MVRRGDRLDKETRKEELREIAFSLLFSLLRDFSPQLLPPCSTIRVLGTLDFRVQIVDSDCLNIFFAN